jgi:hypothetical protein
MIEPVATQETLHDRLMRLKPAGLSTRAWTINAGVGSAFFDHLAAGGTPRDGELPKVLAVVGMTLAEFEGRRRPPSGSAPAGLPTLRVMPRAPRAPAAADPTASADALAASPDAAAPDQEEEAAVEAPDYAGSTAEAVARWLEARRQAVAAGLDASGSEGVRLVAELARLSLEIERARSEAPSPRLS